MPFATRCSLQRIDITVAPHHSRMCTQARTQLQTAQVQATDVDILRADYEHAIAVLIGKAPAQFTLTRNPVTVAGPLLPEIPGALPSQLLERRPDIASEERLMAAANEQIGIAQAALLSHAFSFCCCGFYGNLSH